ncbi:MAG: triose-phosphate isomerase [Alphaproteobacteria bacterium]|nr:triose-phosphate isomerase [Alphaproteobacteria bacterium]
MKFLVANWKMNGNVEFAENFLKKINSIKTENQIVVCPPFPLLHKFENFSHSLGAQNCSDKKNGAFTGEVSPLLLQDLGCKYVIVGHSERRRIFKESNELIFEKYRTLIELNIIPIICVGETEEARPEWRDVLSTQLGKFKNDENLQKAIIAYEPVWSIGSGKTPTTSEIHEVLSFIKQITAFKCPTLYGGSVNIKNISDILQIPSVDGVLIGGASLKIEEFSEMMRCAV